MYELGQADDANGATTIRQCAVFVEEKDIMISRRKPAELQDALGFIQWNKFCDRLDEALGPLRSLAESSAGDVFSGRVRGGHQEQAAKTSALERMQQVCNKLEENHPGLQCTLYCPFHSSLVSNWHIVVNVDCQQLTSHPDGLEISAQAIQSSEMTEIVVPNQVSESTGEEESSPDISPQGSDAGSQDASTPQPTVANSGLPQEAETVGDAPASQSCSSTGRGVLGKDFIEHTVLPTDTFGGICLAYSVSASRLRQANLLSRDIDSLSLAPKILAIPISNGYFGPAQDKDSQPFKLNSLKRKFPKLGMKEAKA